jgi:hypothetical protein
VQADANSVSIARHYFPNIKLDKVTPCFIRSQLGPIFSQMSHQYMRNVLMELERLSPTENATKFPIIISTFSVLLMAMESLQYHVSMLPYHTHHDGLPPHPAAVWEPQSRNLDEMDKSDILIRFYKATNCHAQLKGLGTAAEGSKTHKFMTDVSWDLETTMFLFSFHQAILVARSYLINKRQISVVSGTDMTAFFDRLLSKMYLI